MLKFLKKSLKLRGGGVCVCELERGPWIGVCVCAHQSWCVVFGGG
jgi:hypothetical protein